MINDILGSAKSGAADAASSAKQAVSGRNGADAPSKGFSDALSDLNRDEPHQDSDDIASEHHKSSSSSDHLAADEAPQRKKPIIDIRPESLRRAALDQDTAAAKQAEDAKPGEPQMTLAEKKLREALAAAKAITQKSDGQTANKATDETRGKHAERLAKGDAVKAEKHDDLDQSILAADDAKIADMLTLLGGNTQVEAGQAQVQAPAHKDARSQTKRDKDGEDRSSHGEDVVAGAGQTKRLHIVEPSGADPLSMPSDPEVPGTKQFRFSSARGDGQSVSMSVDETKGDRTKVEFKQGSTGAAENVTVVDSRRFLGLAPNSNSANLTALMSGDHEWAAAMQPSSALSNAAAHSSTGSVVNTLKLQMNPHDIGSVMATLRLHGEELNVHLTVETRAAYRQLSEDSGGILDALRAQGFSVDQVTISIAPTADADTNNGQQQGQSSQTGQQQSMAEGGRQGQAADRGQQQAGNRQATEDRTRTTNDAVLDNAQAPASGSTRPGQLYL